MVGFLLDSIMLVFGEAWMDALLAMRAFLIRQSNELMPKEG